VRELARLMPDRRIARLLNRTGVETGHGNAWTLERVRGFRHHHAIAGYRDGEWAERGEITLEAAAKIIGVCNMTALRMLRRGDIKGRQVCPGAPWVIKVADLTAFACGKRTRAPLTPNAAQPTFDFQRVKRTCIMTHDRSGIRSWTRLRDIPVLPRVGSLQSIAHSNSSAPSTTS
jgi:hypothetical protein